MSDLLPGEFVILNYPDVSYFVRYHGQFDGDAVIENASGFRFLVDPRRLTSAAPHLIEPPVPPAPGGPR